MEQNILKQKEIHDEIFSNFEKLQFHITKDPVTRYLRDRRMNLAISYLKNIFGFRELKEFTYLVVCGGVGGEAIQLKRMGFFKVVNSDLSTSIEATAMKLDSELISVFANAESLPFEDSSFDVVLVQDGLHHLPRPTLGMTEMLRVAKKAIVVIEPRESFIGSLIGTQFESYKGIENFVYRWSKYNFMAISKSYLLREIVYLKYLSIWDHGLVMSKILNYFPPKIRLFIGKFIYGILSIFNFCGNMMVGIVVKEK